MTQTLTARKRWEAPLFRPHGMGALNKFGHRVLRHDHADSFEGVPVDELVATYGSPVFVTSERQLRANVRRIRGAFARRWPDVVHGWSYKTNYTSAVCSILHQEGSWAEVVSRFEYEKARSLGVPGDRILFNGPNKSRAILSRAIAEGAHIHVDHFDELTLIEQIARENGLVVPLTIRLNFETGFTEAWSRFGFNLETGQALEAVERIARSPNLKLTGLHSHIGTFILDPRAHAAATRTLARFMRQVEDSHGVVIESLDIGGGFPSKNALQGIYLPPDQAVPEIEDYADAVCTVLAEETAYRRDQGRPLPRLFIESGRAIVDDSQILLTSVVGTKPLPDGRRSAVLDAGVNLLFTGFWYDHAVRLTAPARGTPARQRATWSARKRATSFGLSPAGRPGTRSSAFGKNTSRKCRKPACSASIRKVLYASSIARSSTASSLSVSEKSPRFAPRPGSACEPSTRPVRAWAIVVVEKGRAGCFA